MLCPRAATSFSGPIIGNLISLQSQLLSVLDMEPVKRFLFWLLDGTRGGPTRVRLLAILAKRPMNLHQLALSAQLDYSTAAHHIKLMEKHSIVESMGTGYGCLYAVSDLPYVRDYVMEKIRGEGYGENKTAQVKKK